MNNPVTLRDLQRALASSKRSSRRIPYEMCDVAKGIAHLCGVPLVYPWRFSYEDGMAMIPVVDRLVARYGPRRPVVDLLQAAESQQREDEAPLTNGEERKKDTDEVHPASSMTTNDTHGGDGRSGEVPEGRSQSGEAASDSRQVTGEEQRCDVASEESKEESGDQSEQRGQGSTTSPKGTADPRAADESGTEVARTGDAAETGREVTPQVKGAAQKVQGPPLSEDSPEVPQEGQGSEADEGKYCDKGQVVSDALVPGASSGNDATSTGRTPSDGDKGISSKSDNLKQAGEDGDSSEKSAGSKEAKRAARQLAKFAAGSPSTKGRDAHGGITAELRKAKIALAIVSKARSVLASWMADGGQDEQSPRWDYPALAARLITRRSPYPARKDELGRPALLVLADVSGSCSSFSGESLLVAKALAVQGMPGCDVLVVSHSNGYPEECDINGKPLPQAQQQRYKAIAERSGASVRSDGARGNVAFYEAMIAEYQVTHVVALGDHDAVDVYEMLALSQSIQQVIWLDNYNCNHQGPRVASPHVARRQAQANIRYVTGCKGAPEFLQGLRVALTQ